uniref:Uncharacterized protein n=1 Tax=Panagrolaimus sp. ES5 TaxID=591445 RepID=A0AC34FB64_9BILA
MKISFVLFLVLVTVTQLYASSNIITKIENKEITTENGTDVNLVEPGPLDVYLSNNELVFEFCTMNCNADFLACFEPDPPGQTSFPDSPDEVGFQNVSELCDGGCGFYVTGDVKVVEFNDSVYVMHRLLWKHKSEVCDVAKMQSSDFELGIPGYNSMMYPSCSPKIENGMVKLDIRNASTECPISIKNAKLERDVITPPNENPTPPPSDDTSAANVKIGIYGWIFVLFSIYILHY